MRLSKSNRGEIIKSHLLCAQNNRGGVATAQPLGKAALTDFRAASAKALQNFAF